MATIVVSVVNAAHEHICVTRMAYQVSHWQVRQVRQVVAILLRRLRSLEQRIATRV